LKEYNEHPWETEDDVTNDENEANDKDENKENKTKQNKNKIFLTNHNQNYLY
jgi:hypothetical protein